MEERNRGKQVPPSWLPEMKDFSVIMADVSMLAEWPPRKISCDSSGIFQRRRVRSAPQVSKELPPVRAVAFLRLWISEISLWWPYSVSKRSICSQLHTLTVRSCDDE